jgi:tetratricopeptide (TPR) repeat protein
MNTPLRYGIEANIVTFGSIYLGVMLLTQLFVSTPQDRLVGIDGRLQAETKVIRIASENYDWTTARETYNQLDGNSMTVLGVSDEIETLIDPQTPIKAEIKMLEERMIATPSRYGYMKLARLYDSIFEHEQAKNAWDKAVEIDPNDFESVNSDL